VTGYRYKFNINFVDCQVPINTILNKIVDVYWSKDYGKENGGLPLLVSDIYKYTEAESHTFS